MTFEQFAAASLAEAQKQTAHLAEIARVTKKLATALAVDPRKAADKRAEVVSLDGSTAAAFARRRRNKQRAG